MEKLHHQACESLEGTWYSHCGVDLNQNSFGCVYVDLEFAGLIHWRVEKS